MNIEIVNILKKYGCAYMETDNKEMLEEIENFIKKQKAAISVTHCCTELCDEERCSYTLNNNSKMCDDCGKVFG
jgi:tRNA G46 methylase TrmB